MNPKRALRVLPFAGGVSFLAWTSTLLIPSVLDSGWDKFGHFAVFGILGWTAQLAVHADGRAHHGRTVLGVLLTAGYGVVDEWIQSGTAGRFPSVGDGLADLAGGILGAWLWRFRSVGDRGRREGVR